MVARMYSRGRYLSYVYAMRLQEEASAFIEHKSPQSLAGCTVYGRARKSGFGVRAAQHSQCHQAAAIWALEFGVESWRQLPVDCGARRAQHCANRAILPCVHGSSIVTMVHSVHSTATVPGTVIGWRTTLTYRT